MRHSIVDLHAGAAHLTILLFDNSKALWQDSPPSTYLQRSQYPKLKTTMVTARQMAKDTSFLKRAEALETMMSRPFRRCHIYGLEGGPRLLAVGLSGLLTLSFVPFRRDPYKDDMTQANTITLANIITLAYTITLANTITWANNIP